MITGKRRSCGFKGGLAQALFTATLALACLGAGSAVEARLEPALTREARETWLEATALALLERGQYDQAQPMLEARLRQIQASTTVDRTIHLQRIYGLLTEVLLARQRPAHALTLLDQAEHKWTAGLPDAQRVRAGIWHRRALAFEQQGKVSTALSWLRRARVSIESGAPSATPGAPPPAATTEGSLFLATLLRDESGLLVLLERLEEARDPLERAQRLLQGGASRNGARLSALLEMDQAALLLKSGAAAASAEAFAGAVEHMRQAAVPHPVDQAQALRGWAAALRQQGQPLQALAHLKEARQVLEPLGMRSSTLYASILAGQSETRRMVGDFEQAWSEAQDALVVWQALLPSKHPDRAMLANNLGLIALEQGRLEEAEKQLKQADAIWAQHPERKMDRACTQLNLGALAARRQQWSRARDAIRQVLAVWVRTLGDEHPLVAQARNQLAEVLGHLHRPQEARAMFAQALTVLRANRRDPVALGLAWSRYADFEQAQGHPAVAILFGKYAVNAFQGLRQVMQGGDLRLQQALIQNRQDVYLRLAARLVDAGRLSEAQRVTAMLKEDELHQVLRGSAEAERLPAELTGLEAEVTGRDPQSSAQVVARAIEYDEWNLRNRDKRATPPTPDERAHYDAIQQQVRRERKAMELYLEGLAAALKRSQDKSAAIAARLAVSSRTGMLRELSAQSGQSVGLLHYIPLDGGLRIILETPQSRQAFKVDVGRQELRRAVFAFRDAVVRRHDVRPTAQRLYRWLIAPALPAMEAAKVQILMVAANDTLRYLPFAALHDGQQWLAERYALSLFTEASVGQLRQVPRADWEVEAFGTSSAHPPLPALGSVQRELQAIVGEAGLPGTIRLDREFDLQSWTRAIDAGQGVLHVASHYVARSGPARNSFLLLGDGTHWSLEEMRGVQFSSIDLLVLSACETALGTGDDERGETLESLAAAAQERQAGAVMASLWKVDDDSTAELMQRFYRVRGTARARTKGEALRQAQLGLIQGRAEGADGTSANPASRGARRPGQADAASAAAAADRRWSHPFYWAPFILMGNWL